MRLVAAAFIFTFLLVSSDSSNANGNNESLRRREAKAPKKSLELTAASSSMIQAKSSSRSFQAKAENDDYNLLFQLASGCNIQFKSNPKSGNISIRAVGSCKPFNDDDKTFLKDLANELKGDETIETDEVDNIGTQCARAAELLNEWPEGLELKFDYDPSKERTKKPVPDFDPTNFPAVPSERGSNRRRNVSSENQDEDESSGHHYRRLAYTSLCPYINSYYYVTHDDNLYNRDDPKTTYYALLSMTPAGPCSDGTYFWKNSKWQCYEPDHDSTVDYAYGNCFGRCGAGCGSSKQFTRDCADHDSCVRFGHTTASAWCNDEFSDCVDDTMFAPNC